MANGSRLSLSPCLTMPADACRCRLRTWRSFQGLSRVNPQPLGRVTTPARWRRQELLGMFPQPSEGVSMASFKVNPQTFWLHDCVSSMTSTMTCKCTSRTVKHVTTPDRGANDNLTPLLPQPISRVGTTDNLSALTTQPAHAAGANHDSAPRRSCTALPSALRSASSRHPGLGVACSNAGLRKWRPAVQAQASNLPRSRSGASLRGRLP